MIVLPKSFRLAIIALTAVLLAGCSGGYSRYDGAYDDGMPAEEAYEAHQDEQYVEPNYDPPSRAEIEEMSRRWVEEPAAPEASAWSCYYSETWNNDWHDDVLCSNGLESHRPYLREWDTFVEHWEIMESAAEYEATLNGGG